MAETAADRSKDLLTIQEAADELRVHEDTIRNWLAKGVIPHVALGPNNLKRVYRGDVESLKKVRSG